MNYRRKHFFFKCTSREILCSRVTSLGCLCTGREEGKIRVTNGLHYRKIKSPSRCWELEREISQPGVHSPERSKAFPGRGSPGISGCPWDRKGCLAKGAATVGPLLQGRWIPNSPSPSQTFVVLNSTLLWEWSQADPSLEHTKPLTDFILQSDYPAESIPSAQH